MSLNFTGATSSLPPRSMNTCPGPLTRISVIESSASSASSGPRPRMSANNWSNMSLRSIRLIGMPNSISVSLKSRSTTCRTSALSPRGGRTQLSQQTLLYPIAQLGIGGGAVVRSSRKLGGLLSDINEFLLFNIVHFTQIGSYSAQGTRLILVTLRPFVSMTNN